ncbi:MAG: hypothetical protein OXN22_11530 [Deltaproteobacteria bacterium]|nr:hypothetical protein [Deltaproteobacteria bacterium]
MRTGLEHIWRRVFATAIFGLVLGTGYPAWGQTVFINEVHYDNAGADAEERLEIAGPAGTDMNGWKLVLYNGKNGRPYRTVSLEGAIPDQQGGYGTLSFSVNRIENGSPDGVALVNPASEVIHFMSYEGGFTATAGPAEGLAAKDIGVRESNSTRMDHSLQLRGSGHSLADFTWHGPGQATPGLVNADQNFAAPPGETTDGGHNGAAPVEVVKESR